jgi:chromosome segregation ATPase
MALSGPESAIIASVVTGVSTGVPALYGVWRSRRNSPRRQRRIQNAWEKRASELDTLLRGQYEQRLAEKDHEIERLRGDLDHLRDDIERLRSEVLHLQNQLLRGGRPHE